MRNTLTPDECLHAEKQAWMPPNTSPINGKPAIAQLTHVHSD